MRKKLHCLSENEIRAYEASLKIGGATILELARESKINRATAYNIIENLIKKGLLTIAFKGKKRCFYPSDPAKVLDLTNKQIKIASQDRLIVEEMVPVWEDVYCQIKIKPKIRFYQGVEGIKEVYEDTLKQDRGAEVLAFASSEAVSEILPIYLNKYISRRFKKGIKARAFLIDTPYGRKHYNKYKKCLLEIKFIKPPIPFFTEVNIYNNKVALLSYGKELIASIIESKEIYNTQKAIFELLWENVK